jgi:hypothetical protein
MRKITRPSNYKEKMQNSTVHPVDAHAQNREVNRISITTILAVFRNLNGKDGSELDRRKSMRRKPRRPKRTR